MAPVMRALITGGGSGIGLATARFLRAKSWQVCVVDLSQSRCEAAAKELNCEWATADVTNYDSIAAAFEKTRNKFGGMDLVFANAGITDTSPFYAPVKTLPPPKPSMVAAEVNLMGTAYTVYLAMQYMRHNPEGPSGTIIATSSGAGIYSAPPIPVYAAAKHGVVGLIRSIAPTLAAEGIAAHAILPGAVATNIVDPESMKDFPVENYTSIQDIVDGVDALLFGRFKGQTGRIVEVSKQTIVHRDQLPFCDDTMARIMGQLQETESIRSTEGGDV